MSKQQDNQDKRLPGNVRVGEVIYYLPKFKDGDKVKVVGTVNYGQDMGFHCGIFPDTVFTVKDYINNSQSVPRYKLVAHGYGIQGCNDSYGNGAIYVQEPDLKRCVEEE